jgi:hypothetical protein
MKKRKFQAGGISDDVRARALKYAAMAGSGTEETEAQKEFIRKQAGREDYGRSKPVPKPAPKPVAKPMSGPMQDVMAKMKEREESRKFQEEMDRQAIPAGSMPQTPPETRSMRSTAPDIPEMSTEQPPAGRKSFGSRILDALTRGGATDVRNMLGAAAPAAMKGFRTVADIGKSVREGKARAALEKAGRKTGKRDKDIERMESESPAQITPRMPNRKEPPSPRDLDELRMSGEGMGFKKGGKTKKYAKGGSVSSRADGIAKRGRTNCKIC